MAGTSVAKPHVRGKLKLVEQLDVETGNVKRLAAAYLERVGVMREISAEVDE